MARAWRTALRAGAALATLAAALLACREDPLPGLQAERAAFLESTVPKQGFWDDVERKGAVLKETRAAEAELAHLTPRAEAVARRLEELRAAIAELDEAGRRSEEVLARSRAERERLQAELRELAGTLVGYETRRRAAAAG
jgi:septal ring factor EnvC (AmiA/AmiB activator)